MADNPIRQIQTAERDFQRAHQAWGKAIDRALTSSGKAVNAAKKKVESAQRKAAKALARSRKARNAEAKSAAVGARREVLNEKQGATEVLRAAQEDLAAAKAAEKKFKLVDRGLSKLQKAADKAVAKKNTTRRRAKRKAKTGG